MQKFIKTIAMIVMFAVIAISCSEDSVDTQLSTDTNVDDTTDDDSTTTDPEPTPEEPDTNGTTSDESTSEETKAKYIFFFIGDGMSAAQINLAEACLFYEVFEQRCELQTGTATRASVGIGDLNIRDMPIVGMATTYAANRYITCSAAAATALATGEKGNIDYVSVSADDSSTPLKTVAEMAKDSGMKVGIVSSVSIDHATPACFYAHTVNRGNYQDIGYQLLDTGFDYFGGGSVKWDTHTGISSDKAAAYSAYKTLAETKGFKYVTNTEAFNALVGAQNQPVIATLQMLAEEQNTSDGSALPYSIDFNSDILSNDNNRLTLADFTAKGAEIMENEDGFFMMVESGKIDWACHANDAVTIAYEMVAFDNAIGKAIEFYNKYPEETLIVITGDHDTGGLALGFAGTSYDSAFELLIGQTVSYQEFAITANEKIDAGASFNDIMGYVAESFGLVNNVTNGSDSSYSAGSNELSNYEMTLLESAYEQSKSGTIVDNVGYDDVYTYLMTFGGYDPLTTTCINILNNKAGLEFSTYAHTAVPVPVFAMGAGEELFSGYYENSDIPKKIMEAAGFE